jgi:hypothetical protein
MKVLRNTWHVLTHAFYFQPAQLWLAGFGLLFLVLALIALLLRKAFSFPLAIMAYLLLLGIPYMVFVFMTRTFISNRRLSMVPGFGIAFGLALLLYTLAAAFTPALIFQLYSIPNSSIWMGFRIMIFASLYLWLIQYCLISRYGLVLSTTAPVAVIILVNYGGAYFAMMMGLHERLLLLFVAVMLGWWYALLQLSRRRDFQPARINPLQNQNAQDYQMHGAALRMVNLGGKASPQTTLLLAYFASWSNRLMNLAFTILASPLLAAVIITLINRSNARTPPMDGLNIYLLFGLVIACSLSWTYGELAARTRLLWLRSGKDRQALWQVLEREVLTNLVLTWCLTGISAVFIGLFTDKTLTLLLCYQLTIIAASLHNAYLHMNAKINNWGNFAQMLAMILSTSVLILVLLYSLFNRIALPVIVMDILMLALTLAYRQAARKGFARVDWLVLQPPQRQNQPAN